MTLMLWKQGRRDEAAGEAAALEKLDPEREDFKKLSALIRQRGRLSDEDFDRDLIHLHSQSFGDIGKLGYDPATFRTPRLVSEGPVIALASEGPVTAYVAQLKGRTRWIELFFAPPTNGTSSQLDALRKEALTSESALVAAYRAGLMDESDIHSWVSVRPSSYSALLLLALRGRKGLGLDKTAMQKISSNFPQHRQWNRWLCYGFSSLEERDRLRNEAKAGTSAGSWMDRLTAVYPVLASGEGEEAASFDADGQRRLVEEIAFAAAERAVPSLARAA